MLKKRLTCRAVSALLLMSLPAMAADATLAVVNAHIWTGDPVQPWAQALATSGNRILAVGSTEEIRRLAGAATRTIDARGFTVTPGFIDSHVHPAIHESQHLRPVFLQTAKSKRDFIERVAAFAAAAPKGAWLLGDDWDEVQWGGELPSRAWIDSVTPDNPVWLTRSDMRLGLANAAALRAAGITRDAKEYPPGTIVRDARGETTGIVKRGAMTLVQRAVMAPAAAQDDRTLDATMQYLLERGITSVHDMSYWWDPFFIWERAHQQGRLKVRVYCAAPLPAWERLADYIAEHGRGDAWFRLGVVKGYVNMWSGSPKSFPQSGAVKPPPRPLDARVPESFYAWITDAVRAGLQVRVHGADNVITDIFERVKREQSVKDPRFGAEHGHCCLPGYMDRYRDLGVIASMQPFFAREPDKLRIKAEDPARWALMFPYGRLLDTGAVIALGTDGGQTPAAPLDVMAFAMSHPVQPGGRPLKLEEALQAYTWAGAYASFEENEKGTLAPGKLADFVVFDSDLTRIAPDMLGTAAKVRMTVVDGAVRFER